MPPWLLLPARALLQQPGQLRLAVDGQTTTTDPFYLTPTAAQRTKGLTVANQGAQPAWYTLNVRGSYAFNKYLDIAPPEFAALATRALKENSPVPT